MAVIAFEPKPVEERVVRVHTGPDDASVIHVIPIAFLDDVIAGKRKLTELDGFDEISRRITQEWLNRTIGLSPKSGDEEYGWVCHCGCELFHIYIEGFCCEECGTMQEFNGVP